MVRKNFEIHNPVTFKENVDIEEALDEAGHGRYNFIVLISCCILNSGAAIDIFSLNIIVPAASCDLDLSLTQIGMLTSISFAGYLTSLPWGYASDTKGRKRVLLVSGTVGFIMSVIASFSINFKMMMILKFLGSCFSTAAMTMSIIFLGENVSIKYRSKYLIILNTASFTSDFFCFVLAYLVLPLNLKFPVPILGTYNSWRLLTILLSVPLGLGTLLIWFLEESPICLVSLGKWKEAFNILKRIFEINNGSDNIYPVRFLRETEKTNENISFCESVIKQTVPIFQTPLLWRTIQLFLLYSICSVTSIVFYMWFPAMVNSYFISNHGTLSFCKIIVANITPVKLEDTCIENGSMDSIHYGMIFTFLIVLLNVVSVIFANWRRTMIISAMIVSGICCIFVDIVHDVIFSIILFLMIQIVAVALGSIESYYVDIFPASHRGLATSLGTMIARISCIGGVNLMGIAVVNSCRLSFYSWAACIFCGIPLAILLPTRCKKDG